MAEASTTESEEDGKLRTSSGNDGVSKKRIVRQPNRRQHEREVQALTERISAKEAELKSYGRPNNESSPAETAERENLIKEQKSIRELKESTIAKRKEFDENIHKLSDDISKKSDVLSRIKANLPHKTEKAIDDNIRKLEYQLQTQHFKLRDEKRIVNEITKLKRSKKEVHEYLTKRAEIESYIKRKEEMKIQRNFYFKKVAELKSKEDEIRQKLLRMKSKTDEAWTRYREALPQRDKIKKEIDGLYDMRRQLHADFQLQIRDYREFSELQRIENERRKEDEKKAQEANHRREWFEYELTREPFQEERAQVECLVTYLHRLLPKGEGQALSQGGSPLSGASPSSSVSSLGRSSSFKDEEGSYTILRKKGEEFDEVFEKAANLKKNKKNKRKSWLNKPLRHSREIFNQFATLGLSAPSTAMEIQDSLDKLQAKMQYYEDAAASVKMAHSAIPQDLSASSSFSSGVVTATDVEDTYDFLEDTPPMDIVPGGSGQEVGDMGGDGDRDESAANIKDNKLSEDENGSHLGGEDEVQEDKGSQDLPSIRESSCDEGSDVSPANLSLDSGKPVDETKSEKLQVEGSVQSDESGSSGSDDGKEAGDVTDDSESTVVANEGESGQTSPGTGSPASKEAQTVNVDPMATHDVVASGMEHIAEGQTKPIESDVTMAMPDAGDDEIDKDREDSGMGDVQEGESKKGGIVERKNEKLKLIVSRKSEKDVETKTDLLTSSQIEYSSDYASNSTGSAVSTPTDILLKREPLLDTSSLCKDASEVEMSGFVLSSMEEGDGESILNANNNSSTLTSQLALERSHLGSFAQEHTAGGEREHMDVFQSVDPPSFPVQEEDL